MGTLWSVKSHDSHEGCQLSLQAGGVSELLPALTHAKQNGLKLALHVAEASGYELKLFMLPLHLLCLGIKQQRNRITIVSPT